MNEPAVALLTVLNGRVRPGRPSPSWSPWLTDVRKLIVQLNAMGPNVPSSGSVALPEKLICWPAINLPLVRPPLMVMFGVLGAWLAVTVNTAALLVAVPAVLVARARKRALLSVVWAVKVNVFDVAPAK